MKKTTEEKMKKEEEEEEEEFDLDKMEVLFMNKPVEEKKRPAKKKEIPRLTSSFGITFNNTAGLPEGYRQHTSHSSNDTDKSFNSMMHKLLYGTDRIPTGGSCNVITAGNNVLKEFSDIKEFGLLHTVLHGLDRLKITQINSLQKMVWPHVFRGRNTCIVGGPLNKQGKTLSYLVPIAAKAIAEQKKIKVTPLRDELDYGPLAIILCSSDASAAKIEFHLEGLVRTRDTGIEVYRASVSDSDSAIKVRLANRKPDFLISRPDFVTHALKKYSYFFGLSRLRYFVVDDAHLLLENNVAEMNELFNIVSHELKQTGVRTCPLQFIYCGQEWNDSMIDACQSMHDPVVVISSPLQGLVYGKVNISVELLEDDYEKLLKIEEILKDSKEDFLIICNESTTVTKIGTRLYRSCNIKALYIEEDEEENAIRISGIRNIQYEWSNRSPYKSTILIATDRDLGELKLNSVTNIIHFDLPILGSDAFGERHLGMWNLFPFLGKEDNSSKKLNSYVLLTPEVEEAYKVITMLKGLNAIISPELEQYAENKLYESLRNAEVCKGILHYGKCTNVNKKKCAKKFRHQLIKEDFETEACVPAFTSGRIEVRMCRCLEVNYYMAQLLYFYQVKNGKKRNVINYEARRRMLHTAMTRRINETGRELVFNPKHRDHCAVECENMDSGKIFTRGRIASLIEFARDGFPFIFRVWCYDIGEYVNRTPNQLYQIPEEFMKIPETTVSVILADIKPFGNEEKFRKHKLPNRGSENYQKDEILVGRVALAIDDKVWVKTLVRHKNTGKEEIQDFNIRSEFLRKLDVGEDNPDHLSTLYRMCEEAGFDCLVYKSCEKVGPEFFSINDEYSWAHVPLSSSKKLTTFNACPMFVPSPYKIFVVQGQFYKLAEKLVSEMNEEIWNQIDTKHSDYATKFCTFYEEGLCVAAKNLDNDWARALITKITIGENYASNTYDVYFVDHGDSLRGLTSKDLFPMLKTFVDRMPFQIIAVRLSHIEPVVDKPNDKDVDLCPNDDVWTNDAIDSLQKELIVDGFGQDIEVMPVSKCSEKGGILCNYYEAYVMLSTDVGERLVEKHYAQPVLSKWRDFEETKAALLEQYNAAFPDSPDETDEDDDSYPVNNLLEEGVYDEEDSEKYSIHIPNLKYAEDFLQNELGIQVPSKIGSEKDTSQKKDTQVPVPAIKSNCKPTVSISAALSSNASTTSYGGSTCGDELPHGMKHPTVEWYQTKKTLTLRVCVPDIKKYEFKIGADRRTLTFESFEPPSYSFKLNIWAKVTRSSKEIPLGQYLVIKLQKLSAMKWEKLTENKYRWLKQDLSLLDEESSKEESDGNDDDEPNYFANRSRRLRNSEEDDWCTEDDLRKKSEGIPDGYEPDNFEAVVSSDEEDSDLD